MASVVNNQLSPVNHTQCPALCTAQ